MHFPDGRHRNGRGEVAVSGLPRLTRYIAIVGLLGTFVSACGSNSSPPLVLAQMQKGLSGCSPAPNPYPAAGITAWDSQIGFAEDWYYNQSSMPVTIESLSLLGPHNLVLHGGVVYEMPHSQHPLLLQAGWAKEGQDAWPATWARRQAVRGAVIPAGRARISRRSNVYVIVADVADATRGGGWALGEVVRYRAGGRTYTIKAETGIGIGSALVPAAKSCDTPIKKIKAAFATKS